MYIKYHGFKDEVIGLIKHGIITEVRESVSPEDLADYVVVPDVVFVGESDPVEVSVQVGHGYDGIQVNTDPEFDIEKIRYRLLQTISDVHKKTLLNLFGNPTDEERRSWLEKEAAAKTYLNPDSNSFDRDDAREYLEGTLLDEEVEQLNAAGQNLADFAASEITREAKASHEADNMAYNARRKARAYIQQEAQGTPVQQYLQLLDRMAELEALRLTQIQKIIAVLNPPQEA